MTRGLRNVDDIRVPRPASGIDRLLHPLLRQRDVVFLGCLARLVPEQQLDVNQSAKYPAATFADGNLLGPPGLFGSTVTKSASSGDTVTLYATGCGPTDPPIPSGQIFTGAPHTVDKVSVTVGGASASLLFAGMSAPGICQFNIVIPDLPSGDQLLSATVGGVQTPDVFLNIVSNH